MCYGGQKITTKLFRYISINIQETWPLASLAVLSMLAALAETKYARCARGLVPYALDSVHKCIYSTFKKDTTLEGQTGLDPSYLQGLKGL